MELANVPADELAAMVGLRRNVVDVDFSGELGKHLAG
jgi:hypothetical protein